MADSRDEASNSSMQNSADVRKTAEGTREVRELLPPRGRQKAAPQSPATFSTKPSSTRPYQLLPVSQKQLRHHGVAVGSARACSWFVRVWFSNLPGDLHNSPFFLPGLLRSTMLRKRAEAFQLSCETQASTGNGVEGEPRVNPG